MSVRIFRPTVSHPSSHQPVVVLHCFVMCVCVCVCVCVGFVMCVCVGVLVIFMYTVL
jgi:hypothetical protein